MMRPGRPRCPRRIEAEPAISYYKPQGVPLKELEVVLLSFEELEAIRLAALEGLDQEEAANRMGVSRRALWEDLQNARRKVANALVNGKAIEIKGGSYIVKAQRRYYCPECQREWTVLPHEDRPVRCKGCGSDNIQWCHEVPGHHRKGEHRCHG
jgi:predicted DNA-binding protein (UPF0251 family)